MGYSYPQLLRALGRLIEQRGLRDVVVTELDDGFLVVGRQRNASSSANGEPEESVTLVVSMQLLLPLLAPTEPLSLPAEATPQAMR